MLCVVAFEVKSENSAHICTEPIIRSCASCNGIHNKNLGFPLQIAAHFMGSFRETCSLFSVGGVRGVRPLGDVKIS